MMGHSQELSKLNFTVFEAIKGILINHFALHEPRVDVYFSGVTSEKLAWKILRYKPMEIAIRTFKVNLFTEIYIDFPSIILCDSFEHYKDLKERVYWMSRNGTYFNNVIYVPEKEINNVLNYNPWPEYENFNSNYIKIVNDTTVHLLQSRMFSPGICGKKHFTVINQFTFDSLKWENNKFFPEKYQNFYGCTLRVIRVSASSTLTSKGVFRFWQNI
jgi:hypothetical protein